MATTNERSEQRNERLKRHSETQQLVRANVENFDQDIYVFAATICEECSKRCYPNQCAKLNSSNCRFQSYLPQELSAKDVFVLCNRCKKHLSSKRTDVHQIDAITVQFPAKFSCETAERRMLPLILCWGCTAQYT
jgi:hypothetical protein